MFSDDLFAMRQLLFAGDQLRFTGHQQSLQFMNIIRQGCDS
jgi:hypothetical protein